MKSVSLATVFLVHSVFSYEFPKNFERCHKNDPKLDNCLKRVIQNVIKLGAEGIPSLNFSSIDPLKAAKLEIAAGSRAVHFNQKYFNLKIYGFSKATIDSAHFDKDKNVITFTMHVPKLEQKAKYDFNGNILIMPIFGIGDSVIQFFDVNAIHTITFENTTKDGKTYFKIKSYIVLLSPNFAHYQFDNLFNGDQQLAANILKVLNDNWQDIFLDVKAEGEIAYAAIVQELVAKLFSTVPVDDLILD